MRFATKCVILLFMKNNLTVRFEPKALEKLTRVAAQQKKTVGALIRSFVDKGLSEILDVVGMTELEKMLTEAKRAANPPSPEPAPDAEFWDRLKGYHQERVAVSLGLNKDK